jgi:hypothetical protein
MSAEQLLSAFPDTANRKRIADAVKVSKRPETFGVSNLGLYSDPAAPNPRLAGVTYIGIELLDERVTNFQVGYAGPEWKTVDQFITRLSEGLRLPNSGWEGPNQQKTLNCNGFSVEAYAVIGSRESAVRVRDTSAPQIVAARREAEREKERQAFKP